MTSEPDATTLSCADLQDDLAELALGTLTGRERAAALAHLQTCGPCSAEVERLSLAGDALLRLAPEVEPPPGFEARLWARLGHWTPDQAHRPTGPLAGPPDAAAPPLVASAPAPDPATGPAVSARPGPATGPAVSARPGRATGTASSAGPGPDLRAPDRPTDAPVVPLGARSRPGSRLLAVAAAVVVAVALAFGAGWALSSRHDHRVVSATAVARAALSSAGHTVGEAATYAGSPARIAMRFDDAGVHGAVSCVVVLTDGRSLRVGTFWLGSGYGSWSAPLPVAADRVTVARVVGPSGTVLATAHLAA